MALEPDVPHERERCSLPAGLSIIDAIQKVPQLAALFSSWGNENIEPDDSLSRHADAPYAKRRARCSFQNYLGSGAHLVKRWSALASRSEPADQA
jgi:hypothetical protein